MSTSNKKISVQALLALKEVLVSVFWVKKELRQFIELTIENKSIVPTIDWENNTKHESVSQLIDRMNNRLDSYQDDLLLLFKESVNFDSFDHLKK